MSIYTKATLGYSDNQVTFNDISTDPYYRTEIRVPQKYQLREQDLPIPLESGVSDFATFIGDVVYMIAGTMYPRSQDTYDTGLNALRDVANVDLNQTDTNIGTVFSNDGYVPYIWGDASGALTKQLFVKPLYVLAAESTKQGYVVPFKLYCKVKDPTIYGATLKVASTSQGTPGSITGSAAYPFSYPIAYGATYYTVTADAHNEGTVPVYPQSIDVYGPVTNPQISNSLGGTLKVACTLNSSSDHLQIQYAKDYLSVTLNGVSVLQDVTSDSTYWKLLPDHNILSLTGTSISSGAYATVAYYDGYSLA